MAHASTLDLKRETKLPECLEDRPGYARSLETGFAAVLYTTAGSWSSRSLENSHMSGTPLKYSLEFRSTARLKFSANKLVHSGSDNLQKG